jgi:hypothetical protein
MVSTKKEKEKALINFIFFMNIIKIYLYKRMNSGIKINKNRHEYKITGGFNHNEF